MDEIATEEYGRPNVVVWDVTFACPLRCTHCYTESGRRPAKVLKHDEMIRVADALLSFEPEVVSLVGGEPLTVPRIADVAAHFAAAGVKVIIYTSGWSVPAWKVEELATSITTFVVSVDGATPAVHDRIRGRAGGYDRAMASLATLEAAASARVEAGGEPLGYAIDYVVTRTNFDQLDAMCTDVAPRFRHLKGISFGAVVPTGLASRPTYVEHELITDEQVAELIAPATQERLQKLAPESVSISTTDNYEVMMHPDYITANPDFRPIEVEPDGGVRGMPIYEGTVGSLLTEDPMDVWRRSRSRWDDPWVVGLLTSIRTRREWADVIRRIDYRYGTDEVRARIDRRPAFEPLPLLPSH